MGKEPAARKDGGLSRYLGMNPEYGELAFWGFTQGFGGEGRIRTYGPNGRQPKKAASIRPALAPLLKHTVTHEATSRNFTNLLRDFPYNSREVPRPICSQSPL